MRIIGPVAGLMLAASLTATSPAVAWEADVHYGLTLWLAQRAGFPAGVARAIAEGNIAADALIRDARTLVVYLCTRTDEPSKRDASYHVAKHHFPWRGELPSLPAARTVEPKGTAARSWYLDLVQKTPPQSAADADRHQREFGAALHALQDSFSHQGEPGVVCEPGYSWGHPQERGGPLEHFADHTHYKPARSDGPRLTLDTAATTYDALTAYAAKYHGITSPALGAKEFTLIDQFAKAATKDRKRQALADMRVAESDLFRICELTISGAGCPKFDWVRRRWDWAKATVAPAIDAAVKQFFRDFFTAWVLDRDLTKTAATFIDLDGEAVKFYQLPSASPDIVAGVLGLWLATDHAVAQQHGHGRKIDAQNAKSLANLAPPDRILVASPAEAFVQHDRVETWFQTLPVPGTKDEYLAVAQFRHTPSDVVIVRARRNASGQWRIVRLQWEITH